MTTLPDQTSGSLPLRLKRAVFDLLPRRARLPVRVQWLRAGKHLEPEIHDMARLVPKGGTAVDIGANHGIYSYFMVRHFDRVVAFEPQPACVETLTSWAGPRVEVRPVALSDRAGESTLSIPVAHGVAMTGYARLDAAGAADSGSELLQVPVERLDDQGLTEVRLMKVDVEGHELEVLRGGEQLLRRDNPVLLVEIEQRHLGGSRSVSEVIEYLSGLGYGAYFRAGDSDWTDVAGFDPSQHQDVGALGTRDYVSMFLFTPGGRPPSVAG
ncbi:MAG TPA: FkbM family methyltransferase [Acidimicrobiales bacterium]|nr:FkbM family methyltransferase [Acidimicrobiales bacterium]